MQWYFNIFIDSFMSASIFPIMNYSTLSVIKIFGCHNALTASLISACGSLFGYITCYLTGALLRGYASEESINILTNRKFYSTLYPISLLLIPLAVPIFSILLLFHGVARCNFFAFSTLAFCVRFFYCILYLTDKI